MNGEGSKKQSESEMTGGPSSKRPKLIKDVPVTQASESSVSSDSDSDCSSSNGGTEPWDVVSKCLVQDSYKFTYRFR